MAFRLPHPSRCVQLHHQRNLLQLHILRPLSYFPLHSLSNPLYRSGFKHSSHHFPTGWILVAACVLFACCADSAGCTSWTRDMFVGFGWLALQTLDPFSWDRRGIFSASDTQPSLSCHSRSCHLRSARSRNQVSVHTVCSNLWWHARLSQVHATRPGTYRR